jgi:ribosome biogenesis GTPase
VLPRRNHLARCSAVPMPSARPHEQVIAANLDQTLPVFAAANPAPKWGMLDRYLVSAEAAGIPACICLTKIDLAQDESGALDPELAAVIAEYRRLGYPVLLTSAVTGEGLEALKEALQGSTSVLLGKSGVGKTSLLNALQPGLGLKVNAVSLVTGKETHHHKSGADLLTWRGDRRHPGRASSAYGRWVRVTWRCSSRDAVCR